MGKNIFLLIWGSDDETERVEKRKKSLGVANQIHIDFFIPRSKNNFLFFSSNQTFLNTLRQCTIALSHILR
jgi:hypothetical protein